MRRRLAFMFVTAMLVTPQAWALQEQVYSTETFTKTFIEPGIDDYTKTPEGGLDWKVLTGTSEKPDYNADGKTYDTLTLDYPAGLTAQEGRAVTLQGYMFPLEDADAQAKFLFGPFPLTCPYHYHVPPTLVMETHAKTAIPFTYDPITLTGTLELRHGAIKDSPYYYLRDAVITGPTPTDGKPHKQWHPLFRTLPPKTDAPPVDK